jgi:hypothetical protein
MLLVKAPALEQMTAQRLVVEWSWLLPDRLAHCLQRHQLPHPRFVPARAGLD